MMLFGKSARTAKRVCFECTRPFNGNPNQSGKAQFFCGKVCKQKAENRRYREMGIKMFREGLKVKIR